VRIRSQHRAAPARLFPRADGGVEVRFEAPQSAITPGQLAVLYDGDRVLGGAPIAHALGAKAHGTAPATVASAPPGPGSA
jgi:tRNA U34 2-thiouridine synthase MnmA/TrmU